ncbi:DUF952 domain-containing protein [Novosphingobium piscinae]|uniref:DUF952 domain-containing protein n=1 Tax=Novosphingobium piscinae TaxID=1507448 RepID=A0A7X1KQ88_9SPHN|nr:DUF952 domain-containing protein [Novosphingobium piscinae]MBC2669494.1 DUF952 domain-containing protein [Novosphingobium piscinae]
MTTPALAYKVLTGAQRAALLADGRFAGAPIDLADGYIHLSTAEQLVETLRKHFAGQDDLWIAAIDLDALAPQVKWEPSRGGQLFPHVYAALPLSAVIAEGPVDWLDETAVRLPGSDTPGTAPA